MLVNHLPIFNEEKGSLVPVEFFILPFVPVRAFWTINVPKNETRGNHAHYKTKQILFCIKGRILVSLFDGINEEEKIIKENEYVFVNSLIWDSQSYLTGKDILLVMCSTPYTPSDYIFDRNEFIKVVKEKV